MRTTEGVIAVGSSENPIPTGKKAILFYNRIPMPFSAYAWFRVNVEYIALCEEKDNACVLCRVLNKSEIPVFGGAKHRLIIQQPDGSLTEYHVVVVKRDLHNFKEVAALMKQYRKDKRSYEDMRVFEY